MADGNTVVITVTAGKRDGGRLYAEAKPDRVVVHAGDTIQWNIVATEDVRNVRPAHFRLTATWLEPAPFSGRVKRLRGGGYAARTARSGLTRVYKYDIMVGDVIVADPEVQIKD